MKATAVHVGDNVRMLVDSGTGLFSAGEVGIVAHVNLDREGVRGILIRWALPNAVGKLTTWVGPHECIVVGGPA